MKSKRFAVLLSLGVVIAEAACGWEALEADGPGATLDAAPFVSSIDAAADALAPAANDSSPTEGGPSADATAPDATAVPCTTGEPISEWTFDSTVEGWTLQTNSGVVGTLSWTGATGNPTPGALEADVTPDGGDLAWITYAMPIGDLSGRTAAAWLWLDTPSPPDTKIYVQTGATWAWADNGTVKPATHAWTCMSIPLSMPSYNGPNYEPSDVVAIGIELTSSTPYRVYVDSVRVF